MFTKLQATLVRLLVHLIALWLSETRRSCSEEGGGEKGSCLETGSPQGVKFTDFEKLVSNQELIREMDPKLYLKFQAVSGYVESTFKALRDECKERWWLQVPSSETMTQWLCKVQCNAFDLTHNGERCGVEIYPDLAMFNHSCQANAVLVGVHHENPSIIKWLGHLDQGSAEDSSQRMNKTKHVIALRDIAFGEEISISYICLKSSTETRRAQLWKNWFFWCQCPSCTDPSGYECDRYLLKYRCPRKKCSGSQFALLPSATLRWPTQ